MADGLFDQGGAEQFRQTTITREKILVVNTSPTGVIGFTQAGPTITQWASSSYASLDPNDTTQGVGALMGPHFVMSGETSDGAHPFGFSFSMTELGLLGPAAVANAGGFTVTAWVLVGNLQIPNLPAVYRQQWVSFDPLTGVGYRQLFHSFDVNACAIRFQIGNILTHGLVGLIFAEL